MQEHDVLLLVKDMNLYFYSLIDACDVAAVYPDGKLAADVQLDYFAKTGVFDPTAFGDWTQKLTQYKRVIFMDFGYETYLSEYVRSKSSAETILFLWNAVDNAKLDLLDRVAKSGSIDAIYTFDPIDAAKHHLKYNTTFYSSHVVLPQQHPQYDVYFGGTDKNRGDWILYVKQQMEQLGLRFLLHCPHLVGSVSDAYIGYQDYLKLASASTALLEILKEGQTGVSLRTMESLFFSKKLITPNRIVKYYRFYHPDNIFILGEDDFNALPDFLARPYHAVERKFIDFFDVSQWLTRFETYDTKKLQQYAFYKEGIIF